MTRINVVPPSELCDQHLLAEFRELTRIPNAVRKGKYDLYNQPYEYTLGKGHVKFFYNKLFWLQCRYVKLYGECLKRGFKVTFIWPTDFVFPSYLFNTWHPTTDEFTRALEINRARITERMPAKPRYTHPVR